MGLLKKRDFGADDLLQELVWPYNVSGGRERVAAVAASSHPVVAATSPRVLVVPPFFAPLFRIRTDLVLMPIPLLKPACA